MDTAFTIYTGVFIAYWLGTVLMLSSAALTGAGLGFLEFMRLWIKPLFWMNFSYFAVAEVIFSAIYWFGFAFMSLTGFMRPMAWLVGIVEPPSDSDDPVFVWAVLSILLFMLIMAPYTYVHARVTKFF